MQIVASSLAAADAYRLLIACVVPRPIAWVSTVDALGRANLAPFSFFAGITATPPTVLISVGRSRGRRKDTALNLLETGEAVVHIPPQRLAEAMVATSADVPHGVDEFDLAHLAKLPSVDVRPPRIDGAPLAMEARVSQHLEVGDGPADVFLLRIVRFHLSDDVLDADGRPDPVKLDATGRLGGETYCASSAVRVIARAPRPGA
ncbi:MAG: flavin reductase family protein [Planctomycetes bacterium]|nr:flavin reductase family protein [Planctomycetota bacterium]